MALAYRHRIFSWLVLIAVVPAAIAIGAAVYSPRFAAPVGGAEAWERAATSWRTIRYGLNPATLSPVAARAVARHEAELQTSLVRARQAEAIRSAFGGALAAAAVALAVLVGGGAVRLAGHLSRQLSRPIDELVHWTGLLQQGAPLPEAKTMRGAPEFEVLRAAFRRTAAELEAARARDLEAAELRAFRALASQVAHELKNPLTPMRFAIARLARDASGELKELIDILETESARLERMAREFGELGRLPEGPPSLIDLDELCESVTRTAVPDGVEIRMEPRSGARVTGHYEPLRRAVQNLVLNAIDSVQAAGGGTVTVGSAQPGAGGMAAIIVGDTGSGIAPELAARIFEPWFTTKNHGTGLGLALVRQTIHHHGGSIALDSVPGRTRFVISLPVSAA